MKVFGAALLALIIGFWLGSFGFGLNTGSNLYSSVEPQVGEATEQVPMTIPVVPSVPENAPGDDSLLSDMAVADDHLTLYENDYLPPVNEHNRELLRDLSNLFEETFPERTN